MFSVNLIQEKHNTEDSRVDQLSTAAASYVAQKLLCKVNYFESQRHLGIKNKELYDGKQSILKLRIKVN